MNRKQSKHAVARVWPAVAIMAIWLAGAAVVRAAEPAAPPGKSAEPTAAATDSAVVLDNTTMWREFQVSGASHERDASGKLVRCAVFPNIAAAEAKGPARWNFRVGDELGVKQGTMETFWSALPPADWAGLTFDDNAWPYARLPQPMLWKRRLSLSPRSSGMFLSNGPYDPVMVLARAKFEIKDPAQVKGCRISLDYWGGVVVYVNGKEAARGHMSGGATNLEAVADDYPKDAFVTAESNWVCYADEKNRDRVALRDRHLRDVAIPAALLRKGVNVVAIETHAAPLQATELIRKIKDKYIESAGWPPIGLLSARLTISPKSAVSADVPRPRGPRVWNCTGGDVTPFDYGNPAEPLRPITINAGRNTVFSGRLVVGSDQPIKGLKVSVTELGNAKGGAGIPASAVRVRYAVAATEGKSWMAPHRFDGLLDVFPAEIPVIRATPPRWSAAQGETFYHWPVDRTGLVAGAVAPLWFTVRVPKGAVPGAYEGTVSVAAEGMPPVTVPLRVNVSGWTAPDPQEFRLQNIMFNAEEAVAGFYEVPLWSDKHFELMGQSLALAKEVNSRQVILHLVCRFHGGEGNPESLVRWVKQADGSYKHDFTIFDKYLDMVAKYVGKPRPLLLGWSCWYIDGQGHITLGSEQVSLLDPATGKIGRLTAPAYGSPENVAFWKPVFDEVLKRIKARGWLDETTLLYSDLTDEGPPRKAVDIANILWPGAEWSSYMHPLATKFPGSDSNVFMKVRDATSARAAWGPGNIVKTWKPSRAIIGRFWRSDGGTPTPWYHADTENTPLSEMRWTPESNLRCGFDGGVFGLDLFPLKRPVGGYFWTTRCWGTRPLHPERNTVALLYPGPNGPVASERFEMFREGTELTEALLDVEQAVAEQKLSAGLLERATRYRDERARSFNMGFFPAIRMQSEEDAKLLNLAGEVGRELERKK